jgi:hypothetical protein
MSEALNIAKEREAFEAWMIGSESADEITFEKLRSGDRVFDEYAVKEIEVMWMAWNARAALLGATQVVAHAKAQEVELLEQARIIGAGGERELTLMAQVEAQDRRIAALLSVCKQARLALLPADESTISSTSGRAIDAIDAELLKDQK